MKKRVLQLEKSTVRKRKVMPPNILDDWDVYTYDRFDNCFTLGLTC